MPLPVEILLCVLLIALILAALRLYVLLGELRVTLTNLDNTRQEMSETVQKLDSMLSDEIAPALQALALLESATKEPKASAWPDRVKSLDKTLAHVEVTTKALADNTRVAQALTMAGAGVFGWLIKRRTRK